MSRDKKRNFSWVYQDLIKGDLVLVMKPHRKSVDGKYRVLAPVFRRAGFRPDKFICNNVTSFTREEFKARFQYEGGLNTKGRRGKRPNFQIDLTCV